jgi:hypothetical protein
MTRSSTANAGAERSSHLGGIGLDVMLTQFAPRDDPDTGLGRDADVIRGPAGLDFNANVAVTRYRRRVIRARRRQRLASRLRPDFPRTEFGRYAGMRG